MSLYTMDGANHITEGNPFEVIPDDMDGDGISDAWAVQYFGHTPLENTTAPDGKWGDKDGDGVSNFAEYISGTDPTNGQSSFKVDLISLAAGQSRLTFHYLPGKKYRVWYSSDLLTWTEVEAPVFIYPSADAGQWLGPAAPNSGSAIRRFYRISVE